MKFWQVIVVCGVLVQTAFAEEAVDYTKQIKPVLRERCYACHGVLKQEGGLRLDTAAFAIKGGESGVAIQSDAVEDSLLLERISATEEAERMPPEGEPLKADEIAAIRAWIQQGAKAPTDEQAERDPRDHWAFKAPVRPAVPTVEDAAWSRNPIDAFIAAEYQKRGLTPQRFADKRIWLRRVSLDLIGLPPTPAELNAFVADESSDAYDKVVTRLLDSPQYGERWGRHWMDIWRYSDWWGLGAEVRNSQKHIWHWRDWIIESLNADKGYDQMLREMLAADEIYPDDLNRLRATGFLARQYFKFNRTSWLDETVEHTSKAMLGLTFNCAKCHDHKYDPFSQVEYYQIRAIFEPYQVRTDSVPGEIDFEKNGIPRAFDCNLDAQTFVHIRGDDRNPDKNKIIEPRVPAFLSFGENKVEPVPLPAEAIQPGLRPFVLDAHLKVADLRIAELKNALDAAKKKLVESEQAAKVVLAITEPAKPATDPEAAKKPTEAKSLVRDDFAVAKPDIWELRGGMWSYENGKLLQKMSGATRAELRLKQPVPQDFEAKLKYLPIGGEMWKSVGITFDGTEAGNEANVYLSSYAGGPKSQVSYKQGANYVYPAEGAQARAIELNKPHELIVRVRGTLVNVMVDGQHSLAYRLPIPRQAGVFQLMTFDALAEFQSFELNELPASVMLAEAASTKASTPGPMPVEQAKIALVLAEKGLAVAELQPASLRARAAADRAIFQLPPAADLPNVINAAIQSERLIAAAKADEAVVAAELEVARATTEKKAEAEKKLAAAKEAHQKAKAAVELPGWTVTGTPTEVQEAARKAMGVPAAIYTTVKGALKTLESNMESEESRNKPFPHSSTGRRSTFAKWITDPKHPLPARVAVNHLWSRHFGRALVPTLFDFGRKGTPPTHPELLDWLAVEFVEHGWSMKHLHRLIVTSNTYRLTSSSAGVAEATLAADPDNRYYWRSHPRRMEAQAVRDSLLYLAGDLDLTMGGASIPANNETSRRRSLYFVHSHNEHQKFLSMFDDANVLECYRRSESIVPQQALALENSPLVSSVAEKMSQQLTAMQPAASDREFTRAAFLMILCVEPTEAEQTTVAAALERLTLAAQGQKRSNPQSHARANLIQALLNHNDFVTVR